MIHLSFHYLTRLITLVITTETTIWLIHEPCSSFRVLTKVLIEYRIAGNFNGGNFDGFDAFQPDRQNLTRQILKAIQCLVRH